MSIEIIPTGAPARRRDPRCRLGRSARHPAAMVGLARARQTPNPVSDDPDRSVRLSPWLRRRGSRSCDTPMAGARRPCSPARPGERRRHPSAVEAPIRLHGSVPSAGREGGSDRAFCRQGRLRSSSRLSSRRTGPGQPCHATRQRESPCGAVQRALSLIQCSSLSYDYPTGGKVRAHPFRPPSGPAIHPAPGSPWAGSDAARGRTSRGVKPRKRKWPPGWKRCSPSRRGLMGSARLAPRRGL